MPPTLEREIGGAFCLPANRLPANRASQKV